MKVAPATGLPRIGKGVVLGGEGWWGGEGGREGGKDGGVCVRTKEIEGDRGEREKESARERE